MDDPALKSLPIAVIGGGPVGLAAAAHLLARGLPAKVYEAGPTVASHVRDWGHVRVFTPWRYCVDQAATELLKRHGWRLPASDHCPTGAAMVSAYLEPLAATPELAAVIVKPNARVDRDLAARSQSTKSSVAGEETRPFVLVSRIKRTRVRRDLGERGYRRLRHMDDAEPARRERPAGHGRSRARRSDRLRHSGYPRPRSSYLRASKDTRNRLGPLGWQRAAGTCPTCRDTDPSTSFLWATRGADLARIFSGGDADQLPARGELGADVRALVDSGRVTLLTGFAAVGLSEKSGGVIVEGATADGVHRIGPVDRIIAATGQRPDLSLTRELRLDLDPWLESAKALGPLIDPNVHSCGSVPPHGHRELSHPEPGFYTVGIKSYGRAPTFLLLTGYEQVRSVAAAIAGDMVAADDVRLVLPETGVCSTPPVIAADVSAGCCDGPAPAQVDACCMADAVAKDLGKTGCGCGAAA